MSFVRAKHARSYKRTQSYLQEKHQDLAKKIVGIIEADVAHSTEPQILAEARSWFDNYNKTGL